MLVAKVPEHGHISWWRRSSKSTTSTGQPECKYTGFCTLRQGRICLTTAFSPVMKSLPMTEPVLTLCFLSAEKIATTHNIWSDESQCYTDVFRAVPLSFLKQISFKRKETYNESVKCKENNKLLKCWHVLSLREDLEGREGSTLWLVSNLFYIQLNTNSKASFVITLHWPAQWYHCWGEMDLKHLSAGW